MSPRSRRALAAKAALATCFVGATGLLGCSTVLGIGDWTNLVDDAGAPVDEAGVSEADATAALDAEAGVNRGVDATAGTDGAAVDAAGSESGVVDATPNPCAANNGGCSVNAACAVSSQGTAACTCNFGWTGDGHACVNNGPTCDASPGSCVSFAPSGGIVSTDLDGDGLLGVTLNPGDAGSGTITVVDVDTGMITQGGAVLRPASTGDASMRDIQNGIAYRQTNNNIAVFTFRALTVPQSMTVRFTGIRAVAIASATTMRIDGILDARSASAGGTVICPGSGTAPGGFIGGFGGSLFAGTITPAAAGKGTGAGTGGVSSNEQGAGAGHSGAGGGACAGSGCATGGAAYDVAALDATHFHGGSGGGGGAGTSPECTGGAGGAGGGAIRLVAVSSVEIGGGTAFGGVNASGCGGGQAPVTSQGATPVCGGGGGGSGGAIVVEAPRVQLDAFAALNATGGGGGSYVQAGGAPNINNQGISLTGCPLLSPVDESGDPGGGSSTAGVAGESTSCAGGGAAGWVLINAGGANPAISTAAFLSPTQASGGLSIASTVSP